MTAVGTRPGGQAAPATLLKTRRAGWLREARRDPLAVIGAGILLAMVLAGVFVPLVSSVDPTATSLPDRFKPPAMFGEGVPEHPLGTDSLGRDVLIRILYGVRISLTIGALATLIATILGVALGLLSGYAGGKIDAVVMRLADIQLGFPPILLFISVLSVLQPGLWTIIAVLGIAGWVSQARVVRAQVLAQRRMEYVQAAQALGAGHLRIVLRHILPNVLAPTIVIASFSIATFIITASSLSFLGLGLPPSTPDWGIMIADGMKFIRVAWWPSTFAGLALSLTVFSVNVLGDWLRDYLDPRLREA